LWYCWWLVQLTGGKWVVTAAEKAQYDEMFTRADTDRDGFVNGAEIRDIFLQSGLPQMVLAHIWLVVSCWSLLLQAELSCVFVYHFGVCLITIQSNWFYYMSWAAMNVCNDAGEGAMYFCSLCRIIFSLRTVCFCTYTFAILMCFLLSCSNVDFLTC